MSNDLPACGIYVTSVPIEGIPAGRLVSFHNHGNPGPGIYLPEKWVQNRCTFSEKGTTLPQVGLAFTLKALPPEGFYRVKEPFFCCDKKCREFAPESLVQIGYNGEALPIIFTPEWSDGGMAIPTNGNPIDLKLFSKLAALNIPLTSKSAQATTH